MCVCVCVHVSIFPLSTLTSGDLVATRKALVLPGWSKSCIAAAI